MSERELVYQIENLRANGQLPLAEELARTFSSYNQDEIAKLSPPILVDKMQLWNISIDSLLSLAKQRWIGWEAKDLLTEAHGVIEYYLYDPVVWPSAKEIHVDPEGNEYQMASEMRTREARFHRQVAFITGDQDALMMSAESFNEAIKLAPEESSAHTMAGYGAGNA